MLWNAMAPELWRRTAIRIPRELARLHGVAEKALRRQVRVSYVKVAEYQRRGVLHFHLVIRLDRAQPRDRAQVVEAPTADFSCELLREAVDAAVAGVTVSSPALARETELVMRWGEQVEMRAIALGDGVDPRACAGYIAKYATKSTEAIGGLTHRLEADDLPRLRVRPHVRRYITSAWRLGGQPHLKHLRLRRWAHAIGFRGHCFTKSRRYSTTFTALRSARHEHMRNRQPTPAKTEMPACELRRFQFTGLGYRTEGDAWLAEQIAANARERRRVAHEELRAVPAGTADSRTTRR